MQFGNLSGLVNGTESVVFDYEVTGSAVASIDTGTVLNGDEDGWYTVIVRHVYNGSNSTLNMYFNADTTASGYGYRGMRAYGTSTGDINSTSNLVRLCSVSSTEVSGLSILRLYAKQGTVRLMTGYNVCQINGTAIAQLELIGSVYSVTNTNITKMVFVPTAGNCGVGTSVTILKSNNFTNGTPTGTITTPYIKGSWVRVGTPSVGTAPGSMVLTGTANNVTFSDLDGDRDVVYMIRGMYYYSGTAFQASVIQLNADTGNNYGQQRLRGVDNVVAAYGYSPLAAMYVDDAGHATNSYNQFETLLFAKQGFVRPWIMNATSGVSGTTIDKTIVHGGSYSVTNTNITSIKISIQSTPVFAIGSQFQLYALRPNG